MMNAEAIAPIYVTVTPRGERVFEVTAMDGDGMVYVVPVDGQSEGRWVSTTYVRVAEVMP